MTETNVFKVNSSGQMLLAGATADPTAIETQTFKVDSSGYVLVNDGTSPASPEIAGGAGAVTINKVAGRAIIASGASTVVVTNNKVTANSIVLISPIANDASITKLWVTVTSGALTIRGDSNAGANLGVNFLVIN